MSDGAHCRAEEEIAFEMEVWTDRSKKSFVDDIGKDPDNIVACLCDTERRKKCEAENEHLRGECFLTCRRGVLRLVFEEEEK